MIYFKISLKSFFTKWTLRKKLVALLVAVIIIGGVYLFLELTGFYLSKAEVIMGESSNSKYVKGQFIIKFKSQVGKEAEELFICSPDQVCKDNAFCYESEDAEVPVEGWFYKISWGVTAPGDVDLTPLKDEQGNRVSFNIKIGDNWLYERDGITAGAIKLKQGASDKDFMARYSLNPNIGKVCVVWEMAPETKTSFGGEESIDDFCNEVETSALKTWDFGGASAGSGASASVSSGEVKPIGGFLK